MKKYIIDFTGYCSIDANSEEEAEQKFWTELPTVGYDDVWDVEGIECVNVSIEESEKKC